MTGTDQRAPRGLRLRGRRLWRSISAQYELSDAEQATLWEACQTADLVDRLAEQLAAADLTVKGSRGQSVLNPIAAELRLQRDLLGRLLARLALPDTDDLETAASKLGQRANAVRWYGRKKGA